MRKLFGRVLDNRKIASFLINPVLRLHSLLYRLAGRLAIAQEGGLHPKHAIIRYSEWFSGKIKAGWTVLDIGCNTGTMTCAIAKKAGFVYGVDLNEEHIIKAVKCNSMSNVEYFCGDATKFDYTRCVAVDCVTLSNVLEHIEDRVDFLSTLVSHVRWNPSGPKVMLIRVPQLERDWITVYKKNRGLDYKLDRGHYVEYSEECFRKDLEATGICVKSLEVRFGEFYAVCEVNR
jgi:SAM-dependent methyltransferase